MKKVLFLILASFLVLAACGNNEDNKSEDKKETKSTEKESKKDKEKKNDDDKKSNNQNKSENTNNEKVTNDKEQDDSNKQDQVQSEDTIQSQEQESSQEEQTQSQNQLQNNYSDLPNGDAMFAMPGTEKNGEYSEVHDYENNGVYRTPEEQKSHEQWLDEQDEWMNASEEERVEIQKRNAAEAGVEYDPKDFEID